MERWNKNPLALPYPTLYKVLGVLIAHSKMKWENSSRAVGASGDVDGLKIREEKVFAEGALGGPLSLGGGGHGDALARVLSWTALKPPTPRTRGIE